MKINIIGVPLFYGCDKKGVQNSPDELRNNGLIDILKKHNHEVYDLGNLHVPNLDENKKFSNHSNMKYINEITDVNTNLAHLVYGSLLSGSFPLVIGGDHALATGSASGSSKYHDDMAIIWIDAHGDINTHVTSPSGNVHGMPLAALMGIGHDCLTDLYFSGVKVKKENVFIIGARDLDEGELKLIDDLDLNVYTTEEVNLRGVDSIITEVKDILYKNKINAVHLSFDIDSIDPTFAPGTGTPVPEGLSLIQCKNILKLLFNTRLIKSMDFVELNSCLDDSDTTLNLSLDLLNHISKYI